MRHMSEQAKILEFISFCVEMFAARNSVSGREAYSQLENESTKCWWESPAELCRDYCMK